MAKQALSLIECFSEIEDPRIERTKQHLLVDVLCLAVLAVVGGAEGWEEIEDFGKQKHAWLKQYLRLPSGIPSHDTISRVFRQLKPAAFQAGFARWMESVHQGLGLRQVAIDGKTLRRSHDRLAMKSALHAVCAWSVEMPGADISWLDRSDDGPLDEFRFARLTVEETGSFSGTVNVRGPKGRVSLPFKFALPATEKDLALLDLEEPYALTFDPAELPSASPVPEPSAASLLAVAVAAQAIRSRRRGGRGRSTPSPAIPARGREPEVRYCAATRPLAV